jgi:hypothetical protein
MLRRISSLFMVAVLIVSTAWAQKTEGLVAKVYEIKNRKVEDIIPLLVGMNVEVLVNSINRALNTVTVRANSEGHSVVEALIKKYDIPRKTIEFQFFLIRAATAGEALKDGLPEKVQKVIKEIAGLTKYKSFEVIDSPFIRVQEESQASLSGKGTYDYGIMLQVRGGVSTGSGELNNRQIRIDRFQITFSDSKSWAEALKNVSKTPIGPMPSPQSLDTSFNIAENETVVIGASQVDSGANASEIAIITVVTAKVLP